MAPFALANAVVVVAKNHVLLRVALLTLGETVSQNPAVVGDQKVRVCCLFRGRCSTLFEDRQVSRSLVPYGF